MKDRLEINKELIPYSFDILLADDLFTMQINYNEIADLFTISLYKENELICNEPVIYNVPLFQDIYMPERYPQITIIPIDESEKENCVTYKNLSNTVFLCIDNGSDSDE